MLHQVWQPSTSTSCPNSLPFHADLPSIDTRAWSLQQAGSVLRAARGGTDSRHPELLRRWEAQFPGRTSSALFIQLMAFTSSSLTDGGVLREQGDWRESNLKKKKSGWKSVRKIPLKNPTIQTKKRCRKRTCALWWYSASYVCFSFFKVSQHSFYAFELIQRYTPWEQKKKKKPSLLKCFQK